MSPFIMCKLFSSLSVLRCEGFLKRVSCFYRCSPDAARWPHPHHRSYIQAVPLCHSFCRDWWGCQTHCQAHLKSKSVSVYTAYKRERTPASVTTACCSIQCEDRVSNKQHKNMTQERPGLHISVFSHKVGYNDVQQWLPKLGVRDAEGLPSKMRNSFVLRLLCFQSRGVSRRGAWSGTDLESDRPPQVPAHYP